MHSLTDTWVGYASIICFCMAYTLVIFEEQIHMRKSKPVILIGCFMWALIGLYEAMQGGDQRRRSKVSGKPFGSRGSTQPG